MAEHIIGHGMDLDRFEACRSPQAENAITLVLEAKGSWERLEIKVSCDVDPSVLLEIKGPEDHTSCMPKISSEVVVNGDVTDEQLAQIERLIKYSPVHGLIEYANTCESRVRRA